MSFSDDRVGKFVFFPEDPLGVVEVDFPVKELRLGLMWRRAEPAELHSCINLLLHFFFFLFHLFPYFPPHSLTTSLCHLGKDSPTVPYLSVHRKCFAHCKDEVPINSTLRYRRTTPLDIPKRLCRTMETERGLRAG